MLPNRPWWATLLCCRRWAVTQGDHSPLPLTSGRVDLLALGLSLSEDAASTPYLHVLGTLSFWVFGCVFVRSCALALSLSLSHSPMVKCGPRRLSPSHPPESVFESDTYSNHPPPFRYTLVVTYSSTRRMQWSYGTQWRVQ